MLVVVVERITVFQDLHGRRFRWRWTRWWWRSSKRMFSSIYALELLTLVAVVEEEVQQVQVQQ
jgi:hypothetical protein